MLVNKYFTYETFNNYTDVQCRVVYRKMFDVLFKARYSLRGLRNSGYYDGSPDGSLQIAERITKDYNNITIISQPNCGLSAARNTGLSVAQGDYVWFVDSDDWIKENCLGRLLEQLYNQNLEALAICAANHIDGNDVRRFSFNENENNL